MNGLLLRLLLVVAISPSLTAQDVPADPAERARQEQETGRALEQLRRDVATLKTVLSEGQRAESQVIAEVADAERAVSDHRRALATIDARSEALATELERIGGRQQHVQAELDAQRAALAALLRLDHARSRQAPVKRLLDPDRTADLARSLGYSRFLQRSRIEAIRQHAASLVELAQLADAHALAMFALAEQQAAADSENQALTAALEERGRALAALRQSLADHQQRLGALARDEQAMLRLLEQLRDIFADLPDHLEGAQPFRSLRGQLPWPVAGEASAGTNGGLRIAAEAGAQIVAVAHGRVAFADWLRGYGLLLILDHGDGYMSLYGHNETLLRQEGAWVAAGEAIAQVGRSGGESQALLYFELRERGRSIDPRPWLRRR